MRRTANSGAFRIRIACALIANKELNYETFYFGVFVRNYSFSLLGEFAKLR
jgi:hypothetical protein